MEERYKKIEEFETMRSRTFCWALGAAVLHKAATWFGGAALAWATVVLLGGFASQLAISDFLTITLLVLGIIFLLALALFTCKLVTKKSALSTGSLHPLQLTYHDPLLSIVNGVKFKSIFLQCVLLIWAFTISASKIHRPFWHSLYRYAFSKTLADNEAALPASIQACLQSCATNHHLSDASALQACSEICFPAQNSTTANLQVCLFTFHLLVITTCITAALCNVYVLFCIAQTPKSLSLARYHDEVLSRGLSVDLVEADAFDWRDFLLRSVGEDLVVRNIAPLEVKRQNEDFIEYLFYYPKGVEMVMGMLASENSLLQQTAANMPGFWSFDPKGMEKDGIELLSRLGEKLGLPGKAAEGAANSFKSLAIAWSGYKHSPLLKVYVSGESSSAPVLTSGEGTLQAPVGSGAGGVESPNAVSRSGGGVEGGSEPINAVSRSGGAGGGDGASRSSISTESINVPSSSEVAGRGGSGTSESSSEGGEGHGRSQSRGGGNGYTDSVSGGPGEGAGESMSTLPESSKTISGSSWGAGHGAGAADRSSNISGGHGGVRVRPAASGGGGGRGEQKWNVVQKVVDLVANKRLPTLQVYVRALDSFFMSKSVRNSLTTEEWKEIKSKLLLIIEGRSNRASANDTGHKIVEIDSSMKARTRLLAFSALDRLREPDDTWEGGALLEDLDGHLNEVQKNFVIWFEEVNRYKELCEKYPPDPSTDSKPRGEWLKSGKWDVRGNDFPTAMKSQG